MPMKEAMKAKDQKRVGTLRLINAALKDRDIAARTETSRELLGDDEILSLLAKMIKQREDSITAYDAGNRPELAEAERDEIAVIREFMPKQMSAEATQGRDHRGDRRDRRDLDQGHGQGDGRAERALRRPDGFRQGERHGEDAADEVISLTSPSWGGRNLQSKFRVGGEVLGR